MDRNVEGRDEKRTPRFRWRLVPATVLLIVGTLWVGLSLWRGFESRSNPHNLWFALPLLLGGLCWVAASFAWRNGRWWRAAVLTAVGFLAPQLGQYTVLQLIR